MTLLHCKLGELSLDDSLINSLLEEGRSWLSLNLDLFSHERLFGSPCVSSNEYYVMDSLKRRSWSLDCGLVRTGLHTWRVIHPQQMTTITAA